MKQNRSRRRRNPTRRPPANALGLADHPELILACENIATLAALLEDYRPDGCALINGTYAHGHVGRMLASEAGKILRALRPGKPDGPFTAP